ncbi:MAG: endolytic transglycosylase MltG, partial [Candidatus Neomarinimicrobiota bacterium]
PSEYNTYLYKGLPPGPVNNPGLASIQAAVAPADVDYLYFVANDQGRHIFSTTLDEHNEIVRVLRQPD